jgi:hypothetical protein
MENKMKLLIKELNPNPWGDLERLLGEKGGWGGCWCMYWRLEQGEKWAHVKGNPFSKVIPSNRRNPATRTSPAHSLGPARFRFLKNKASSLPVAHRQPSCGTESRSSKTRAAGKKISCQQTSPTFPTPPVYQLGRDGGRAFSDKSAVRDRNARTNRLRVTSCGLRVTGSPYA